MGPCGSRIEAAAYRARKRTEARAASPERSSRWQRALGARPQTRAGTLAPSKARQLTHKVPSGEVLL